MTEKLHRCNLCLIQEKEVLPILQELKEKRPDVEIALFAHSGTLQVLLQSEKNLDEVVHAIRKEFPTFYYGEGKIVEAVHREFIARKKTLALAESCTGGAIASQITHIPHASQFFLGSIVAYSDQWKERFLEVSRSTLKTHGAVSCKTTEEMVQGLFQVTDADYAVAVSGIAGPTGGTKKVPVGTISIAIGKRGEKVDAGMIHAPPVRHEAIELAVNLSLGALWRRLVHNAVTFS